MADAVFIAPPPALLPGAPVFPPRPGQSRLIADERGSVLGLEVWTGAAWVDLLGIRWAASLHHPGTACFHLASVVVERVLPAEEPR